MVWETRKVLKEMDHCQFASLTYFPCCLLMSRKDVRTCAGQITCPTKARHFTTMSTLPVPDTNPSHLFAYMPAWTLVSAGVRWL